MTTDPTPRQILCDLVSEFAALVELQSRRHMARLGTPIARREAIQTRVSYGLCWAQALPRCRPSTSSPPMRSRRSTRWSSCSPTRSLLVRRTPLDVRWQSSSGGRPSTDRR